MIYDYDKYLDDMFNEEERCREELEEILVSCEEYDIYYDR